MLETKKNSMEYSSMHVYIVKKILFQFEEKKIVERYYKWRHLVFFQNKKFVICYRKEKKLLFAGSGHFPLNKQTTEMIKANYFFVSS